MTLVMTCRPDVLFQISAGYGWLIEPACFSPPQVRVARTVDDEMRRFLYLY